MCTQGDPTAVCLVDSSSYNIFMVSDGIWYSLLGIRYSQRSYCQPREAVCQIEGEQRFMVLIKRYMVLTVRYMELTVRFMVLTVKYMVLTLILLTACRRSLSVRLRVSVGIWYSLLGTWYSL